MSPLTVFVRTLLKSSAICLGIALAVVQPSVDFGPSRRAAAHPSPAEAAVDGLLVALEDADPGVRGYAAAALGKLHSRRAVPALIDVVRDNQPEVRMQAVTALGKIGDSRSRRALNTALHDPDECVRSQAEWALDALR